MLAINDWLFILTFITALSSGLLAGAFFAFSAFIMKALARLSAAEGIALMNSVNITIMNSLFMLAFVGTALTSIIIIVSSIVRWQEPYAIYLLLGGLFYLVGSFLETIVFNVPKNNALAKFTPFDPKGASYWADYLTTWTAWNHVRTIASLAAMAFLIIALCL